MKIFYYVHTGHRIGLDRFRRAAAIINALKDVDITLLTSDFRIASVAKEYGIKRSVGIDLVRNIPQIAHHGDAIIFDSAEHNPTMLDDMTRFFSIFIRISDNPNDVKHPKEFLISPYLEGKKICKAVVVAEHYFEKSEKNIEKCFFFGDDDYEKDLQLHLDMFKKQKMDLGLGFYYFLDYEESIAGAFEKRYEFEEYEMMIKNSKILLSASPQAVLENLASGGRPIYLQRPDYPRDFLKLFELLDIPIVDGFKKEEFLHILEVNSEQKYNLLQNDTHKVTLFIKETLTL
jgi:hypothetical protein